MINWPRSGIINMLSVLRKSDAIRVIMWVLNREMANVKIIVYFATETISLLIHICV